MNRSPFFIIGCQRSGTTLLRLMLNGHSKIAIPEEGGFWKPLLNRFKGNPEKKIKGSELKNYLKYIENNTQFQMWKLDPKETINKIREQSICTLGELMSAFYHDYAIIYKKNIWGDKTPSFFRMVAVLDELFPLTKFIHLVRDGRDIYLSWQKMKVQKRNVSVAALEWSQKIKRAKKGLSQIKPERYIEIRYEDLVSEPENTLNRICTFLQVEYEPTMLNFWRTSDQFIGSHHSDLIFKPVSLNSVEKWKNKLTEKEISYYESIAGPVLLSLGYDLQGNSVNKKSLPIDVCFELAYGLPLRLWTFFYTNVSLKIGSRFGIKMDTAGIKKAEGKRFRNKNQ